MKQKKVLVLGGSIWQLAIIEKAMQMGFFVVVADILPDAPGKAIANDFLCIDTNDKLSLLEYVQNEEISIVLAEQTDRVVPVAAFINENMNFLAGIDIATAEKFTDKYLMREALLKEKVAMPNYQLISNINQAKEFAKKNLFPIIIKPRSSQSSFGVFKICTENQLVKYFPLTMKYSKDGTILVEQFIKGTEVTIEGISLNGTAYPLAISEKEHFAHNDCVSKKLIYPTSFNSDVNRKIEHYIKNIVEILGLVNGIFHAEIKIIDDKPYLVEVAARGGGQKIASVIVPFVSGIDMYESLLRKLNGEDISINNRTRNAAILGFFDFKPGRVKKIHGLTELQNSSNVFEIVLRFKEGDEINSASDDTTRVGYYIILADTHEQILQVDKKINETISIEYF